MFDIYISCTQKDIIKQKQQRLKRWKLQKNFKIDAQGETGFPLWLSW